MESLNHCSISAFTCNKVKADFLNITRNPSSGIGAGDWGSVISPGRFLLKNTDFSAIYMRNWVTNQPLTGMHVHDKKLQRGKVTCEQLDDRRSFKSDESS